MAQKASREAAVTIADQSFRVCFSILGIVALRDHWKLEDDSEVLLRIDQMGRELSGKDGTKVRMDFHLVRDLFWAGLRRHHPEVTLDQALVLLDDAGLDGLPGLMNTILSTLSAAAPPQGARQARPLKAKNGASPLTS